MMAFFFSNKHIGKLNTANPENLIRNHEQVSILGGVRIEGLDRMKVTVKVECGEQVIKITNFDTGFFESGNFFKLRTGLDFEKDKFGKQIITENGRL